MLTTILTLSFIALLAFTALEDHKHLEVPLWTVIVLDILSAIIAYLRGYSTAEVLLFTLWLVTPMLVINLIVVLLRKDCTIGLGDIILAPGITLFMNNGGPLHFVLGATLGLIIYTFIFKKRSCPVIVLYLNAVIIGLVIKVFTTGFQLY